MFANFVDDRTAVLYNGIVAISINRIFTKKYKILCSGVFPTHL
jgi:hypothetical protein